MNTKGKRIYLSNSVIGLLGILLLAVILRLIFFYGSLGSMAMDIAEQANSIFKGIFDPISGGFTSRRIGLIYPIALMFWLFGINNFSLALYPLLCSLGSIIITFYIGKILFNERIGLLGALLLCFYPLDIRVSTCAYPDGPTAFWGALSILLFIIGDKTQQPKKSILAFLLSGLSLGFTYLCKFTGTLVILFFLGYILYNRKIKLIYLYTVLSFVIIVICESLVYYLHTNIWFYSLHTISTKDGTSVTISPDYMLKEMWRYPRSFFISLYPYGFFFYFTTISAIYGLIKRQRSFNILLLWIVILFLYLQFGTTSFSHYALLSRLPRYLAVISIPIVLLTSAFLIEKQNWLKGKFCIISVVFLILTSLFFSDLNMLDFEDARTIEAIYKRLGPELNKPVYIDERAGNALRFLYNYKKNKYIKFYTRRRSVESFQFDKLSDIYVAAEFNSMRHANRRWLAKYPDEIFTPPPHWEVVEEINNPGRWSSYLELKMIKWLIELPFVPKLLSKKILNTISDMDIEKDGVVHYIPDREKID
ncbi:MAG: glycosyltransferase family 39 protein [bacterium]